MYLRDRFFPSRVRFSRLVASLAAPVALLPAVLPSTSFGAGIADLTAAIDVAPVETAIVAGAVLMIGVVIVIWGISKVIGMWGRR